MCLNEAGEFPVLPEASDNVQEGSWRGAHAAECMEASIWERHCLKTRAQS